MKPKILVFCDYYLPGFKSGGGMWTVVNLVDRFCDRYDFYVVTRNHDGRDDKTPYSNVQTGEWNRVGNADVFYLSNKQLNRKSFSMLIDHVNPNAVFLNSIFSTPAINFLLLRKKTAYSGIPVVIATCGELSKPTLALKKTKKRSYLYISRIYRLFDGVLWKASTELEREEIQDAISVHANVMIAPDLPPKQLLPSFDIGEKPQKVVGKLKLSFVSRIARKKNLDFLLRSLGNIKTGEVSLDIVGPFEDREYWQKCLSLIEKLPRNIKINVVGGVKYDEVLQFLIDGHFFILPTMTENFGYVFVEAMAAGCPLIISERTIWNDLEDKGIGWNVSIDSVEKWTAVIEKCIQMDDVEYRKMSLAAREHAENWLADPALEEATAKVLKTALA